MKIKRKLMSKSGFSLSEMLVTVGIIVILLAVAIPAIANAAINFKMTELNSTARQIFIASQNNLTSLKTRGLLESTFKDPNDATKYIGTEFTDPTGTIKGKVYYLDSADTTYINDLLPVGSIDQTVADKNYTILYNPATGIVLEVFYKESAFSSDDALNNFRGDDKASARRDERLGFYNGKDITNLPTLSLDTPTIEVINEDRLTVSITTPTPIVENTQLVVVVENPVDPTNQTIRFYEKTVSALDFDFGARDSTTGKTTFLLDSLYKDEANFSALVSAKRGGKHDFPYMDQINIYAYLQYTGSDAVAIPSYSNEIESNGLYESQVMENGIGPNIPIMKVGLPRHLQNLDKKNYPVDAGTNFRSFKVKQTKLISWPNKDNTTTGHKKVSFDPIIPNGLLSYDGSDKLITNIWIDKAKGVAVENTEKTAGLFATLAGESATKKIKLSNIRLTNPSLEAEKFTTLGSLVGKATNVDIDKCHVYIIDNEVKENATTGKVDAKASEYKVIGKDTVGGMIGEASNITIKNSFSGLSWLEGNGATPTVGGLIGKVTGSNNKIDNTYSVVDDLVAYNGTAAMFVAGAAQNSLTVTNSYAVGNILGELTPSKKAPTTVNGFFNTGTSTNSYCAVTYLDKDGNKLGLTDIGGFSSSGTITTSYYLTPIGSTVKDKSPGVVKSYQELSDINTMGVSFVGLNKAQSNPYKKLEKDTYPFKGLKTKNLNPQDDKVLPHYGSWPDVLDVLPLPVYYEKYSDNSFGLFYFKDVTKNVSTTTLKGNAFTITESGYGVLLPEDQEIGTSTVSIEHKGGKFEEVKTPFEPTKTDIIVVDGAKFKLTPLTVAAINSIAKDLADNKTANYHSAKLKFSNDVGDVIMQVHPLLGAAINIENGVLGNTARPYQVRTLGQLASMNIVSDTTEHYKFRQTHNIEAGTADNWESITFANRSLDSSVYLRETQTISNLNAPLFSQITGDSSEVKDVTLNNSNITVNSNMAGIVANSLIGGTIIDTTVQNSSIISTYANADSHVAGFVGTVGPTSKGISNSEVIDTKVDAKGNAVSVGFVGVNHSLISDSIAQNIEVSSSSTGVSDRYVSGFVGTNSADSKGIFSSHLINAKINATADAHAVGFAAINQSEIKGCQIYGAPSLEKYVPVTIKSVKGEAHGFVGVNSGLISYSGTENTEVSSSSTGVSDRYVSGFVGTNSADSKGIVDCTIVNAQIIATADAIAVGFVAINQNLIEGSTINAYVDDTDPGTYERVTIKSVKGDAHGFVVNSLGKAARITKSSVTANVTGSENATGFAGNLNDSTVTTSYANCQVVAKTTASGFVQKGANATIENCYAMLNAKTSTTNGTTAGFALETGSKTKNSFTTSMVYGKNVYGFAKTGNPTNSYYMGQNFTNPAVQKGFEASYEAMIDPTFAVKLGRAWTSFNTEKKCLSYDSKLIGKFNPFPMIKGIIHYGDWMVVPDVPAGLVYYEKYVGLEAYSIYGFDSDGLLVNTLRDNIFTIEDAGYGMLLPQGAVTREFIVKYGDGGSANTETPTTMANPFDTSHEISATYSDAAGGETIKIFKLFKFRREGELTLGNTINQFDAHLSVPIEIQNGTVKTKYDMAPYSARGVSLYKPTETRVLFGTVDTRADVRTIKQLGDVEKYIGLDPAKVSPTRYFSQTHNVAAKDWVSANGTHTGIIHNSFINANYDGMNNKILDSSYTFITNIGGNSVVKNVTVENTVINYTTPSAGWQDGSEPGIFAAKIHGIVDNCHVVNSSISHTSKNSVSGFAGSLWLATGGATNNVLVPEIKNSSVNNVKISATTSTALASGFVAKSSNAIISNSAASNVTVSGTQAAGFVVENTEGAIIKNSYSSGTVKSFGAMGIQRTISGFVINNTRGIIDNSYSSVILDDSSKGAVTGFVQKGGKVTNCYSVSRTANLDSNATPYGFNQPYPSNVNWNTIVNNCYYLGTFHTGTVGTSGGTMLSYADMTMATTSFPATEWMDGKDGIAHPNDPTLGAVYPFPMLRIFGTHYGDWPRK